MAHATQAMFFYWVRDTFPEYFTGTKVLDVGSLNINGCNKILFPGCDYTGLDIGEGENVDIVCVAHEHDAIDGYYDAIISSECFEHDMHIEKTLKNIVRMLRPGGLFAFTCAADNRAEHGTRDSDPGASPFTSKIEGWCDYYRGLNIKDFRELINFSKFFNPCTLQIVEEDLHGYGIKKDEVQVAKDSPKESFDEFASHNAVSRLIKTPYHIVCAELEGEEEWFVVKEGKMYPIDEAFHTAEHACSEDQITIKHQGEMLLKEDLGCMNTKQE